MICSRAAAVHFLAIELRLILYQGLAAEIQRSAVDHILAHKVCLPVSYGVYTCDGTVI